MFSYAKKLFCFSASKDENPKFFFIKAVSFAPKPQSS